MSSPLIARSPDLSRLREQGYEVDIRGGHVVVTGVPYVTETREVERGTMVIALTMSGDETGAPPDHTVHWVGSLPCHQDGTPIERIQAGTGGQLTPELNAAFRFSSKPLPAGRYADYYEQFVAYIRIVSH